MFAGYRARDIQDLLEQGILVKDEGGGRSTSYSLEALLFLAVDQNGPTAPEHDETDEDEIE